MNQNNQHPLAILLHKIARNKLGLSLMLIGFVVGVLWFGALRFLLHDAQETHYHSNFAVYVDGIREEFRSFTYYEEVAACTTAFADNPKGRTHLHDQVSDVIHVHDKAVTYADFFSNIDWTLGPDFVRTADGLIVNTPEKSWTFIVNGEKKQRIDTTVIGDQDKLLMSYGTPDIDYQAQFDAIENKAKDVNQKADPATCSGVNGPHDNRFSARLKRAFSFTD